MINTIKASNVFIFRKKQIAHLTFTGSSISKGASVAATSGSRMGAVDSQVSHLIICVVINHTLFICFHNPAK